jgi:tetratricopeptide (TPR) repeat protein
MPALPPLRLTALLVLALLAPVVSLAADLSTTADSSAPASAPASASPAPAGNDWNLDFPSPMLLTRGQLPPGQNPSPSGIRRESHLITSDANTRATGAGANDTPEDPLLVAVAQRDHDFFQALELNPKTWSDDERDSRAQAINDDYLKFLDDNPTNLQALILYGKFLRLVGERAQAYVVFQHAYRINAKTAVVNQELGNYLAEEGQYVPALGFFVQAVELAPNEPLYHYQLGELLNIYYNHYLDDKIYTEDTLNRALIGEFARAAALDPSEPGYAWRYAESYYDILDPDWNAALAAWDSLAKRTTSPVELEVIRLHRARVLLELNRNDEARPLIAQPVSPALEATRAQLAQRLAAQTAAPTPAPAPAAATPLPPAFISPPPPPQAPAPFSAQLLSNTTNILPANITPAPVGNATPSPASPSPVQSP